MKRHEISKKQWNRLKDKFPPKKAARRPAWKKQPGNVQRDCVLAEHRNTMAGSAGAVWAMASVYSRFRAWTKWENILIALIEQDLVDETTLMLDSTTIKVHQHASGAKKGDITRKPDGAEGA